tara:strand:- start:914 stop:2323 length:1410 start_codon:yes stop_codon:yes gene_type:complete
MALTIEQNPLYNLNTVGQEVIFTVSDATVVAAKFNVKYIAEVHIGTDTINLATSLAVGTFKTTPNNAAVGMYDFRPIIESFVSADNVAPSTSKFKGVSYSNIPVHTIDKYSLNENTVRYLKIRFKVEGATTSGGTVSVIDTEDSAQYTLFNGYLKRTDILDLVTNDFGYDTTRFYLNPKIVGGEIVGNWLTNAPTTQYANLSDYGTLSMYSADLAVVGVPTDLDRITITYYNDSGTSIGTEDIDNLDANGGFTTYGTTTEKQVMYFGCFPANLRNWSSTFTALVVAGTIQGGSYTIGAINSSGNTLLDKITINLNCPTLKGYEPIRLAWLNQWGAWDYYTFTMKSAKTTSTKGSTYQQIEGTWNESVYQINGFKGGKKAFRVNATEKISMNTDFVSESESEWFEDLINSPEVYILDSYQPQAANPALNQYATPVRLTTSNFTRKTVANDKLMQYTFEVEKSKTLRTQSV